MKILHPLGFLVQAEHDGADLRSFDIRRAREAVTRHRLLVLRGFKPFDSKEALADYCTNWGELLLWDFGAVFEVVEHDNPTNYLFTSGSVPYHWDGAFAKQVPWLQVFQCLESPGSDAGGETLFCDTVKLLQEVDPATRVRWEKTTISYFTEKVAHYGGKITAPLIGRHPRTGEATLRFAEPANADTAKLNTPELEIHGLSADEANAFITELRQGLYDTRYVYAHAWQPGDYVIADNHALLHGRSPYRGGLARRLWRVHVVQKRQGDKVKG
jgi:alpha-ketoglutarate-dependent taurine dioxygenase